MNSELKVTENLIMELQEAEQVEVEADSGTYSVTYEFGGIMSIICC